MILTDVNNKCNGIIIIVNIIIFRKYAEYRMQTTISLRANHKPSSVNSASALLIMKSTYASQSIHIESVG